MNWLQCWHHLTKLITWDVSFPSLAEFNWSCRWSRTGATRSRVYDKGFLIRCDRVIKNILKQLLHLPPGVHDSWWFLLFKKSELGIHIFLNTVKRELSLISRMMLVDDELVFCCVNSNWWQRNWRIDCGSPIKDMVWIRSLAVDLEISGCGVVVARLCGEKTDLWDVKPHPTVVSS